MWEHFFDWVQSGSYALVAIGAGVALLAVLLIRLIFRDRGGKQKARKATPTKPPAAPAPTPVRPRPEDLERGPAGGRVARPKQMPVPVPAPAPAPAAEAQPKVAYERIEQPGAAAQPNHDVVTVHFGTDRNDTRSANVRERFDGARARAGAGSPVSYGTCEVSIPRSHRIGELEAPGTFQRWNPDRHVMLLDIHAETADAFFQHLSRRMAETGRKQAFVFVHGFSVAFEDAARRTAQMAYDLKFKGAPIFFSWPTEVLTVVNLTAYTVAENNASWATPHFAAFLTDVVRRTGAKDVHLIAHSMGNRVVTQALIDVFAALPAEQRSVIKEVILTAPDIDADVFIEQIAPRLASLKTGVTLYASSRDKALEKSKMVHGYPRIGDFTALTRMPAGIEVIDASEVETDPFGHSYYGNSESVISDICHLLTARVRAAKRAKTLRDARNTLGDLYWLVRKETKLADVLAALTTRA